MWYVELDVHLRQTAICILDSNGKGTLRRAIQAHWKRYCFSSPGSITPFDSS